MWGEITMSNLGQDIFGSFVTHVWDFAKNERRISNIKHMSDAEWAAWRNKKLPEIRANATRLASQMNDKQLHKRGMTREDLIRRYELLMRNDESVGTGRSLVAGMDIRGLDLRQVRGLHQDQIDQAQGDSETQLSTYLEKPPNWR
jgi:hypothetical protein